MGKYESPIKSIAAPAAAIFAKLSDMEQLRPVFDNVKDERIKGVRIDRDSIYCEVEQFGEIGMRIIETEPCKTIKFESDKSPLPFNAWIQLVEVSETDTRMKLTLKADIPIFLKPMLGNKVEQGLDLLANALASINYGK